MGASSWWSTTNRQPHQPLPLLIDQIKVDLTPIISQAIYRASLQHTSWASYVLHLEQQLPEHLPVKRMP
jgi:hypothetical protein